MKPLLCPVHEIVKLILKIHTVTQPEAAPTDVQGYIHRKDVYNVHR
jgi:hypothetical protein